MKQLNKIKKQIFGDAGFSSDMHMEKEELQIFRELITDHWLTTIHKFYPNLSEEAKKLGIENYHQISGKVEHNKIWPKTSRVLPQHSVDIIKKLPFFFKLKEEFGDFTISDIYDTEQHYGHEEIYWRLVRPNVSSDIGPLHKDKWFHGAFNGGYGMFTEDVVTLKVWIPIYCEAGKSGLSLLEGSHLREWPYHIEILDGLPKPIPDEDLSNVGACLISTEPGNLLIFHENILHGGAINLGTKTRVSAEITLVMPKVPNNIKNSYNEQLREVNSL